MRLKINCVVLEHNQAYHPSRQSIHPPPPTNPPTESIKPVGWLAGKKRKGKQRKCTLNAINRADTKLVAAASLMFHHNGCGYVNIERVQQQVKRIHTKTTKEKQKKSNRETQFHSLCIKVMVFGNEILYYMMCLSIVSSAALLLL